VAFLYETPFLDLEIYRLMTILESSTALADYQLSRVTPHLRRVANELRSATEPLQITFRKERMQVRGLQEIIEEMEQRA